MYPKDPNSTINCSELTHIYRKLNPTTEEYHSEE
jgi:hypothetical protein